MIMKSMQTPKLMVVDSEPVITDTLIHILRSCGYDCTPAYDGDEAIEKARQLHPQVILMDVFMPRMLGTDAARTIRDEQPECKIVLLSGSAAAAPLHKDLQERGYAIEMLPMPLHPKELLTKLRELGFQPPMSPPWE